LVFKGGTVLKFIGSKIWFFVWLGFAYIYIYAASKVRVGKRGSILKIVSMTLIVNDLNILLFKMMSDE